MVDNETLLAISDLLDKKLKPVYEMQRQNGARFDRIDEKFEKIDERFDRIDKKFDQIDERFEKVDKRLNKVDAQLAGMNDRIKNVELLIENDVSPRLQNIERCYVDTYQRYAVRNEEIDALKLDNEILKKVVQEHSRKLQTL